MRNHENANENAEERTFNSARSAMMQHAKIMAAPGSILNLRQSKWHNKPSFLLLGRNTVGYFLDFINKTWHSQNNKKPKAKDATVPPSAASPDLNSSLHSFQIADFKITVGSGRTGFAQTMMILAGRDMRLFFGIRVSNIARQYLTSTDIELPRKLDA